MPNENISQVPNEKNTQEIDQADRKERIKLLQKYLRTIALEDTRIPIVAIDGFFYQNTADAVMAFQEIYALPINGEVDEQTWNSIYQKYIELVGLEQSCLCLNVFDNPDAELKMGNEGYVVYFLQVMLLRISDKYKNFPEIKISGVIDEDTDKALREIRKTSDLHETDASDEDTLQAIATVYCSITKK